MPRKAKSVVPFYLRLPPLHYSWLRREAFKRGTSMTAVLLELISREAYVDKKVEGADEHTR